MIDPDMHAILQEAVAARRDRYETLSDDIWDIPELLFEEHQSMRLHADLAREEGFRITEGLAGMPTALLAEAGEGGPVIAFLGEYDALPGLSQQAGIAERRPVIEGGNGHGCGHNMLGAASLLAASATRDWLLRKGMPGRVRYYGCPAEEGGGAKVFMVRDGCFDDVDIAITWHPAGTTRVDCQPYLANTLVDFRFFGRAAHAATSPHLGRSALDAVELMNVGVNYLREHMPPDARIHYAVLDSGGKAANVVQEKAVVQYCIRARDLRQMNELLERVRNVARGAALMTETRVEDEVQSGTSNMLANPALRTLMYRHYRQMGPVPFDDADRAFATDIAGTLQQNDIRLEFDRVGMPARFDLPLCDFVVPNDPRGLNVTGSTDVADVSWKVPTVQGRVATHALGTPPHSWQIVAQGKSGIAHKAIAYAAEVMAATACSLFSDPEELERARADHRMALASDPYECPMPAHIRPRIADEA